VGKSTGKDGGSGTSRRAFVSAVGLAAAAPVVAHLSRAAAGDRPATKATPLEAAADALAEAVRVRHGKHLTAEQLKHIRQDIQHNLRAAESLRHVKLTNADEPAFTFSAEVP
jgi:hypothetical protein